MGLCSSAKSSVTLLWRLTDSIRVYIEQGRRSHLGQLGHVSICFGLSLRLFLLYFLAFFYKTKWEPEIFFERISSSQPKFDSFRRPFRGYSLERQLKQPFGEMSTSIFNQFTFMSRSRTNEQFLWA